MSRLLVAALVVLGARAALAVDPVPKADTKEKVENIRQGGALKVEKKPVVTPAELQKTEAPATETAPPPPPPPEKETSSDAAGAPHLFGLHASLGLPHPINYGLNYVMPNRMFSFEFSTGSFGVKTNDVDISLQNLEVGARWHPFTGSFFVGALFGNQKISGKKSERITDSGSGISYDVDAEVEVKSNYITPHLGWMWGGGSSGFFMMFEMGVQSPSGVKSEFSSNAPGLIQNEQEYINLKKDVEDGGDKVGNTSLPYVALLKLGWLF